MQWYYRDDTCIDTRFSTNAHQSLHKEQNSKHASHEIFQAHSGNKHKGKYATNIKKDANGAYGGAQNGGSMILDPHTHLTESPG